MLESKTRIFYVLLIGISASLHVLSISVMTYLGTELTRNQRMLEEVTRMSVKNFRHLFRFRNDSIGIIGIMNRNLDEMRTKVNNQAKGMRDTSGGGNEWIKSEIDKAWRVGCPLDGIANGTHCFVMGKNKVNYTEAIKSCKRKGGELAIPSDKNTLEGLYRKFPLELYFIDAKYNKRTGIWETSHGDVADFLPSSVTRREQSPNGSCVYAHRRGFNRWHCEAKMNYLCSFY